MTVLLVGVGADSGNVRPRPSIGPERRFEYIPIPEKSRETTESRTFGSMAQRYGDGTLADLLDGISPRSDGEWLTADETIREWPVHYDPNLEALTYGEGGKDQNVRAIDEHLGAGDVIAFYTGLETAGYMHRYVFGYFTVAAEPVIIGDDMTSERRAELLQAHGANAHAKRPVRVRPRQTPWCQPPRTRGRESARRVAQPRRPAERPRAGRELLHGRGGGRDSRTESGLPRWVQATCRL